MRDQLVTRSPWAGEGHAGKLRRMMPPMPRLLPVLACLLAVAAGRAVADDVPPEITSDWPAYCLQLHQRVETLRLATTVVPPLEVGELSAEGLTMCDNGRAKGGVMRLRRALAILMHPGEAQR